MPKALFDAFVQAVADQHLPIEGIALADAETILYERRFAPDQARNIYSHTKSFVSTAAGIAVDRGLLSVEDRILDFFPECAPRNFDPRLKELKLKHVLTMSSGFGGAYLMENDRRKGVGAPDYMKYILSLPLVDAPGAHFFYSNADTYTVGRMVEKAAGVPLGQFVYENIFAPMEIGWPKWEHDPLGHAFSASGLHLRLTDMLKLGQLYLSGGCWGGKRIVSEAWVKEASAWHIDTPSHFDWGNGYGYQFWRSPYPNAYRADGAYGQITTVLPDSGLVVSIQCPEYGNFPAVRAALHELILTKL